MVWNEIWSRQRATRIGLLAGLAALILWPAYAIVQEPVRLAFIAALALTAACGASMLAMTSADMLTMRRGRRVLPAQIVDLALGAMLALPSAAGLADLFG